MAAAMLSRVSSSAFLITRASSITCWPSRPPPPLLPLAHLEPLPLQGEEKGRLDHVDADGRARHALAHEDVLDLTRRLLEESRLGRHRPAHADHAGQAMG